MKTPNQLKRELMSVNGLNPWDGFDSSSRKQMFASHLGQALVVKGSTERFCQTGMEREYGKYTFSIKMPCNALILRVIERYRAQLGGGYVGHNPQTVVVYENVDTKEIGILNIPEYCSYHQYFGFAYKVKPAMSDIRVGAYVAEGTILADSPSVTDNGGYKYGVECNMALMSHPATSEDGIMICEDVLDRFSFKTYETRVVEWGSRRFPLNIYGDAENFKPFPDIGEMIREDGMLMCLRSFDKNLAVVEQSVYDLMEPDHIFDKATYVAGGGGRVVDIRVHHDTQSAQVSTPAGMEIQAERYDTARRQFYQDILNEFNRLKRDKDQRGEVLNASPEFHRLVVEALSVVGDVEANRVTKLYRKDPLDDWRLEFVIEYDIKPTIGFKFTGCHGDKGVACKIAKPEEMPIDENGNRADIVMDPNSTISRMNIGRLYEQYINAASRDVRLKIIRDLQVDPADRHLNHTLQKLEQSNPELFTRAWDYLLGYYAIVSPKMVVWMTSGEYASSRVTHLASIISSAIYLYMPPDNDPEGPAMIAELEKFYRPTYGPVSYVGNSGKRVTTKKNVRIGSMYIMLLEKIGDDWTAVSSGKLQHFGVLSQVTNADKYSQPTRNQAIRAWGEAEVRIAVSYAGPRVTADILDRNNNPLTHKQILHSILSADKPTDIAVAVNRDLVPMGGSKPLQLIKHIAECGGWKFNYSPFKPTV